MGVRYRDELPILVAVHGIKLGYLQRTFVAVLVGIPDHRVLRRASGAGPPGARAARSGRGRLSVPRGDRSLGPAGPSLVDGDDLERGPELLVAVDVVGVVDPVQPSAPMTAMVARLGTSAMASISVLLRDLAAHWPRGRA